MTTTTSARTDYSGITWNISTDPSMWGGECTSGEPYARRMMELLDARFPGLNTRLISTDHTNNDRLEDEDADAYHEIEAYADAVFSGRDGNLWDDL